MKTIIVPLDFSEYSLKGLDVAILLATKVNAAVEMVYVQKETGEYYPSIRDQQLQRTEQMFQQIMARYADQVDLRYIIKHGKVHQEIVNQAEAYKDALIVMATHGVSGFDGFFLGSNATKIMASTEVPIITINTGACPATLKKILLPIDFTLDTRQKVDLTAELAKSLGAEIVVLALHTGDSDLTQKVANYSQQVVMILTKAGIKVSSAFLVEANVDGILAYAASNDIDLISVMAETNSSLSRLLLGSSTETMLLKAEIPVLSQTPKKITISEIRTQTGGH